MSMGGPLGPPVDRATLRKQKPSKRGQSKAAQPHASASTCELEQEHETDMAFCITSFAQHSMQEERLGFVSALTFLARMDMASLVRVECWLEKSVPPTSSVIHSILSFCNEFSISAVLMNIHYCHFQAQTASQNKHRGCHIQC